MSVLADFLAEPQEVDAPWFCEPKDKLPGSELQRQQTFIALMARLAPAVDVVAIPNAGKSSDWERVQRWKEGARAGALDLVIAWNHGVMFVEFKDGTKGPTKPQRERLNRYFAMGHRTGLYRRPETLVAHLREAGAPFLLSEARAIGEIIKPIMADIAGRVEP